MPKVTAAHREARRRKVLEAALVCFSRNGFHATGMADVIQASGLSAGAVYRYFRSKDDLIALVVERVLVDAETTLERLLSGGASPLPGDAVAELVSAAERTLTRGPVDLSRVVVQAWAEALRSEAVMTAASGAAGATRAHLVEVARRAAAAGYLPADCDPVAVGQVLASLVPGFLLQRSLLGDVDAASYGDAVRVLLPPPPSR